MHVLVSEYGILDNAYRVGDLEAYSGVLDFEYDKISKKISLRAAAQLFNNRAKDKSETNGFCNCNGKCEDLRCGCFSKKRKCSSHCHTKSRTNICCNSDNKKRINKRK